MAALIQSLVVVVYGLAALGLAMVAPVLSPQLQGPVAWLAGGVVLALCGLLHLALTRRGGLGGRAGLDEELEALHDRIDELAGTVEEVREAGNSDALISEVRLLQGLVSQLHAKAGARATAPRVAAVGGRPAPSAREAAPPPQRALPPRQASVTPIPRRMAQGPLGELGDEEVLDITRRALAGNRVDLYLQPVVSLPNRKVCFFETFSRIRDDDGRVVLPNQYIPVAIRAGLISTIDNLLLFRTVQLVRRARKDGVDVGFFCNVSPHSLHDEEFFGQFVEFMSHNKNLANFLIFELSQSAIADAGVEDQLQQLASSGFTFSLDRVDNPKIDFVGLARRRFRYIKLPAPMLLGQADGDFDFHIEDVPPVMKKAGVELIGEKVENEETVDALLELGVGYAQGYLFGEPRLSRDGG